MITIVNTGVANIASVLYALERLGKTAQVTQDAKEIAAASHVILPGVGTASASMINLQKADLENALRLLTQPVLGICLGMQLLYDYSTEGEARCLGILNGTVKRLNPEPALPVPHMGWNQVKKTRDSRLLEGLPDASHFYFVHSFRAPDGPEVAGVTDYAENIPAVIEYKNWFGAQFHPERSGEAGEKVLRNFLSL